MVKAARAVNKKADATFRTNEGTGLTISLVPFYTARVGVKSRAELAEQRQAHTPEWFLARARFDKCLEALEGDNSSKALYLRMRSMLCQGKHHEIIRPDFLEAARSVPAIERGRIMGVVATAYFRSGMRPAAENALREAYPLVANDPDALAEVQFYDGVLRWSMHELERADALVQAILPLKHWRAKALDLKSWIRGSRGDYHGQLEDLVSAYRAVHGEDVWEKASILRAAAALARELYDSKTAHFIANAADALDWSDETSEHECYTYRYLAWCAALGGNSLASYDYLTRARMAIPSAPHEVLINADRAMIARYAGETDTSNRFLEAAQFAAFTADWRQNGESRTALLVLAEIVAPQDADAAKGYIDEYTRIRTAISPIFAFGNRDRRLEALEQYAAGVVHRYRGERDLAIKSLKRALKIWTGCGYKWRAALAAFHLGEIDRPHYIDMSARFIDENVPRAFFSSILWPYRKQIAHPDVLALSPTRREVLACFIAGMSNEQIAKRLDIQLQTVKNNMRFIFRHFGARSGRDLWPVLRKREVI